MSPLPPTVEASSARAVSSVQFLHRLGVAGMRRSSQSKVVPGRASGSS
jgi:hypothetical protein